jgi:DNA-directed RNA polymerase subunit beta'
MVPKPAKLAAGMAKALGETRSSAYVVLHKKASVMSRVVARQVVERVGRAKVAAMPMGTQWLAIVDNDGVTWDTVESVEKTGIRETGYDLTVPGFETFMSVDGVVLSNTMSVTVPITEAARRESFNLMPSNNLFYDKDRKLAFGLSNDIITGLFMLTKPGASSGKTYATADEAIEAYENNKDGLRMGSLVKIEGMPAQTAIGWLIFSKIVPPRFMAGVSAPIDGPKLKALLENIAKTSPGDFNNIARNISQAGFQAAALSGGASSSINELAIDRTKIKRLLEQMERQIAKGKTVGEKRDLAMAAFKEHSPELDRMSVEHLDAVGGAYSTFLKAKPSGKITPDQFRQMLVSPVLVSDVQDQVVPTIIRTGYGGGMTTSDYILTTPGARKGMVAKSLATALPGFLAKEIAGNMGPVRIGEKDCGTQQGIELALVSDMRDHDADLLDRHLLHDIPGTTFKRNDMVTPRMLADLRDRKAQMIWVRSPMTCESNSPPCQMCAGRAPNGELHPVGSNIGLNYGQAVSEPSTQLTLKIFHSGGTIGSGDKLRDGFARLRELLGVPGTIRDQGVLADITGDVTGVRPAPQGGQYVSLRASDGHETEQHVLAGRTLKVKKGDRVEAGQPLSDGNYLPQEIAAKRGLLHAQQYVVDEARKAYASAGVTVRKPVLEVLAAGMMRYIEITDDGHEKGVTIGDIIPENEFKKLQKENPRIMGRPSIPGVSFKPLLSKDLMERLNFQRLEGSMMEVPAMAGKSDLRGGASPIPGIAYGALFRPGQSAFELDSGFVGKH